MKVRSRPVPPGTHADPGRAGRGRQHGTPPPADLGGRVHPPRPAVTGRAHASRSSGRGRGGAIHPLDHRSSSRPIAPPPRSGGTPHDISSSAIRTRKREEESHEHIEVPLVPADQRRRRPPGRGRRPRGRRPARPGDRRRSPTSARSPAAPSSSGFEAALTPTGAWCEDAWVSTAMLSSLSERLKFLVAFRRASPRRSWPPRWPAPSRTSRGPAAAQRRHRRREPRAADVRRLPRQGRPLRPHRRVPRDRARGSGAARPSTFHGEHLRVRGRRPRPAPRPAAARSTSAAPRRRPLEVAAQHADVYLTWGEPPAAVAEKIERVRELAADAGPRAPLRHPAAHHRPRHLRGRLGRGRPAARRHRAEDIARVQDGLAPQRVGGPAADARAQRRARKDDLEIHPNLWAGVGLVRGGAGTAWSAATPRSPT